VLLRVLSARWLLVVVWMAVIFAFSSWPSPPSVSISLVDFVVKKTAHFTEFGILAVLLVRALARGGGRPTRRQQYVALGLVAVYAALDELHQVITPGRFPSPVDVGIDILGAITFLWLWARLY
jgi:VanZ family protein